MPPRISLNAYKLINICGPEVFQYGRKLRRESSQSALDRVHGFIIYGLENCMSKPAQRLRSRPLYGHALSEASFSEFFGIVLG